MNLPKIMLENTPAHIAFIKKLTEITEANLANEHFGVQELANEVGLSHSQIHRKLHAITNQSTSQFIRELRLEKAKEMLQHESLTASEIAYKVGFSSPSYFNKCFHEYFGYTPGEIKNHTDETPNEINKQNLYEQSAKSTLGVKDLGRKKMVFIVSGVIVIILFSFFSYQYMNGVPTKNTIIPIAVLPLTNASDDPNNQYLADGIMKDISNRLSHIHNFEVKSTISTKVYKSSDISIYQIAEELGVSYIIEGLLYKTENGIRLYVNLIHTKNDKTIWSRKYDDDLSDALSFVSNVSKQIVDELEAELTPEENEFLDKKYTENEEAYNLYLEGRFYGQFGGEENIRKSIEYYNLALEIDSNYCLAYAGLSDAFLALAWHKYTPKKEAITKSKSYALKALSIDDKLPEVHTTLGSIAMNCDWNWNLAQKEFKKALEIYPNHARAHYLISMYYDNIGERDKSRKHINRALTFNPYSQRTRWQSYHYYLKGGEYEKALNEARKLAEINKSEIKYSGWKYNVYVRQQKYKEALAELKIVMAARAPSYVNDEKIDSIFAKSGMEGLIRLRIECELNKHYEDKDDIMYTSVAWNYALLNEKDSALLYLEKAFDNEEALLVRIKYNMDYLELREEPRFLAILDKMNLGGY